MKEILIASYDLEVGGVERSLISMLDNFDYENNNVDLMLYSHSGDFMNLISKSPNLLKEDKTHTAAIYKMTDVDAIGDNGFNCYPLLSFDEDKRIEIYFNEYMPKSKTEKSAHYNGVEEYALITEGTLTLYLNVERFTAIEGEVIRFLADKPHFYFNETDTVAKAFVLMFYPK